MSRIRSQFSFPVLALLSLAVVFSTCAVYANATLPTITTRVSLLRSCLAGRQAVDDPGEYSVKADESKVVVTANGKEKLPKRPSSGKTKPKSRFFPWSSWTAAR